MILKSIIVLIILQLLYLFDSCEQYPELLVASYNNNEEAPHEPDGVALVWNMKYKKTTPEYVFHCQVRWPFSRLPTFKNSFMNVDNCLFSSLVNMMISLDWHLPNHSIFANRCQQKAEHSQFNMSCLF